MLLDSRFSILVEYQASGISTGCPAKGSPRELAAEHLVNFDFSQSQFSDLPDVGQAGSIFYAYLGHKFRINVAVTTLILSLSFGSVSVTFIRTLPLPTPFIVVWLKAPAW